MASYKIETAPRALRDLKTFSKEIVQAVSAEIDKLAATPRPPHCKKLKGSHSGEYRIRVGNHRILYQIHDKEKMVHVLRVRDRKDAYR